MADDFGFLAGAKGFSEGLNTGKAAGKEISKGIESIKNEAVESAQERARERRRAQREVEFKKQTATIKALQEYQRRKLITDEEAKLKIDFLRKYGAKEWEQVLKIKTEIARVEDENNKAFQSDLRDRNIALAWCFFAAFWVTVFLKYIGAF